MKIVGLDKMKNNLTPIKRNKFLTLCAEMQKKHWIINLLIVRLSALWFTFVLMYFGADLNFVKQSEQGGKYLTLCGIVSTIIIICIMLFGEIVQRYSDNIDSTDNVAVDSAGFALLNTVRKKINNICQSKSSTLLSNIDEIKTERYTGDLPIIVSDPNRQLYNIVKEFSECLRSLLEEDNGSNRVFEDLYVSLAYILPEEDPHWHWATEEKGMSFDELLSAKAKEDDCISTFQYIIKKNLQFVFFNSKEKAKQKKIYKEDGLDERDSEGHLLGSIACMRQNIKMNDTVYVEFILTVTTYSKAFSSDTSPEMINNVRHNMKEFLFNDFVLRIRTELCLLYLDYLYKKSLM